MVVFAAYNQAFIWFIVDHCRMQSLQELNGGQRTHRSSLAVRGNKQKVKDMVAYMAHVVSVFLRFIIGTLCKWQLFILIMWLLLGVTINACMWCFLPWQDRQKPSLIGRTPAMIKQKQIVLLFVFAYIVPTIHYHLSCLCSTRTFVSVSAMLLVYCQLKIRCYNPFWSHTQHRHSRTMGYRNFRPKLHQCLCPFSVSSNLHHDTSSH